MGLYVGVKVQLSSLGLYTLKKIENNGLCLVLHFNSLITLTYNSSGHFSLSQVWAWNILGPYGQLYFGKLPVLNPAACPDQCQGRNNLV